MNDNQQKKPIGGIAQCALYPTDAVHVSSIETDGCKVRFTKAPYKAILFDDSSSLCEQMIMEQGAIRVTHTLKLVSDRNMAGVWLEREFAMQATDQGVIAVVTLSDGRSLLVGYSQRLGKELPMRLHSLISDSAVKLNQTPTLTLTLQSEDTAFAMPIKQIL